MGIGIGNLKQIASDFGESLNQIFGSGGSKTPFPKGGVALYKPEYGGLPSIPKIQNWTGNTQKPNTVRYGFAIFSGDQVTGGGIAAAETNSDTYYLDIPPQAITQKEIFATNIAATRKGIIVETEGVIFKDIMIQGTTGVFPGQRGKFEGSQSQIFAGGNITDPPKEPAGVDPATGRSKNSKTSTVTGYEEFLGLRQFFLRYASEKVKSNGNKFLVFLNEKDGQSLLVEPLEFTMERNSKAPLQYNYRIVLKAIGTLNALFVKNNKKDKLDLLSQIGNISANISSGIAQVRSGINETSSFFQKTFQAIDQTVNGPLRQIQFAMEDLAEGTATVLSLPSILMRNYTDIILGIREASSKFSNISLADPLGIKEKNRRLAEMDKRQKLLTDAEERAKKQSKDDSDKRLGDLISNASNVPMPRSFVQATKNTLIEQSYNIADSVNMGSSFFDTIKGRVPTNQPNPLKIASDEEFLLMGSVFNVGSGLNQLLATNSAFQSDAEKDFEDAQKAFTDPNQPVEQNFISFSRPKNVRQIVIRKNDTLERIALNEMGDATRWPELVILNSLKPPYIDVAGGDGIKRPGEYILVGTD